MFHVTCFIRSERSEERRQAILLTYGCFFAEFLGEPSLVRLRLLDVTTCVGLRYGFHANKLRDFSRKRALPYFPRLPLGFLPRLESPLKAGSRTYLKAVLTRQTSNPIMRRAYYTSSSHRFARKLRNINRISIGCGFRHSLRTD